MVTYCDCFFPAAGNRRSDNGNTQVRGSQGWYWLSSTYNTTYGWYLSFSGGNVYLNYNNRSSGFTVRCVALSKVTTAAFSCSFFPSREGFSPPLLRQEGNRVLRAERAHKLFDIKSCRTLRHSVSVSWFYSPDLLRSSWG